MSKGAVVAVRAAAFLFLLLSVFSLFGSERADDVTDKTALYLSFFLVHFPLLAWLRTRTTISLPVRTKIKWGLIGVVFGLVGGYFVWNALLYVTIELIRGGSTNVFGFPGRQRFDMRASWGVLLLAGSLALLIAAKPYFSGIPKAERSA